MTYSPHAFEINTLGTSEASKFVTTDSNGDFLMPDSDKVELGDGSDMQLYHDATDSYITNKTGALKVATETSGIAVSIGHTTSEVTVNDNLTVTGDLTVNGTTTSVNQVEIDVTNAFVFEGSTADAHETTLSIVDPTADATINLPAMASAGSPYYLPVLAAASTTAITATPEELNILDGVTSTAAELNILDGVTATAAELNILDGVTATATELNYLDISTLGTAEASKAVTVSAASKITLGSIEIEGSAFDIDGGTIDGATIATSDVTVGSSKTLDVSSGTLTTSAAQKQAIVSGADGATIDNCVIGGSTAAAGTFTTLDCTDGAFAIANLDIDGGTDIGEAIVDADLFIVDNGAGGTNRKCTASRLKTYISGSSVDSSFSDGDTVGSDINLVDASGDNITVKVPENSDSGTQYIIKKTDSSTNTVTIARAGSDTIDGSASKVLYHQYETLTVVSDGSNWHII